MNINNEAEYESLVRSIIEEHVVGDNKQLILLENKKAVDILLCRNGDSPALFFIEIKFHKETKGRLGFGSANGRGFQPEILSKRPDYFERNMRWIIGDESHGGDGFILVSNKELSNYIAGNSISYKHNNIKRKLLLEGAWFNKKQLIESLISWMM